MLDDPSRFPVNYLYGINGSHTTKEQAVLLRMPAAWKRSVKVIKMRSRTQVQQAGSDPAVWLLPYDSLFGWLCACSSASSAVHRMKAVLVLVPTVSGNEWVLLFFFFGFWSIFVFPRSFVGLNLFLFRRFLCLLHFVYDASNIIMNVAELAGLTGKNGVVVGSPLKLEGSGSLCWWNMV